MNLTYSKNFEKKSRQCRSRDTGRQGHGSLQEVYCRLLLAIHEGLALAVAELLRKITLNFTTEWQDGMVDKGDWIWRK
ncbi:MAG: hypothetical protein ACE14T_04605 [Syntrophales bacterium]